MDHPDIRTFYPYTPNEVKHRKRTSRAQLKVLEDHFRRDTKPNATLRKILAEQLEMSIRGVQVWFQNRRAKEKALAAKALSARKPASQVSPPRPPASSDEEDRRDSQPQSPSDTHQSGSIPPESTHNSSQPSPLTPPTVDSSSLWQQHSPSPPTHTAYLPHQADFDVANAHLINLRRGSLPSFSPVSDMNFGSLTDQPDPFGRRRSVDTSLLRLATHPYAPHARAKNGAIFGGGGRYPSYYPISRSPLSNTVQTTPRSGSHQLVPILHYDYPGGTATADVPYHTARSTPNHRQHLSVHPHIMSSRTVSSPLPGPLPVPGFSFGAPATSSPPQIPSPIDRESPDPISDLQAFAFPRHGGRVDDPDTEDDATSASYDAFSRFGSISSLAGSESSNTSACYSDVGSCDVGGYKGDARREFLTMISSLDVTCPYSSPSSSSTVTTVPVSPGGTPHDSSASCETRCLPISRESELAFALTDAVENVREREKEEGQGTTPTPSLNNIDGPTPSYFYVSSDEAVYPSADPTSTDPAMEYAGPHFQYQPTPSATVDGHEPMFAGAELAGTAYASYHVDSVSLEDTLSGYA